ncbi:hypothetical protein [Candidatus Pelagibacter sp. HIMB1321]|uniref:hypothetical protein n=1 Tax=Candidatus Pelagibacter sp. HIMB1321 TaxID=1388755 RepID=UPI000A07F2EE|nr:hypothetical protein [Candidatus Pelagibacter sp. HIMB1321]SMF79991.1 hypothetical protein SAMN02744631_1151 [Candidatus Pelagibacter sp. HIMB1321]
MKFIRNYLRKLRYELKFLSKKKEVKMSYIGNANVNNDLENLMNIHGSDKGGRNNHHNYASYYSEIFYHKKDKVKNFLEIGLGTNNINMLSNMGKDGVPLASLRAWRDYFKNANIYGADIDKDILKDEDRIKTFFVDQTNPKIIKAMYQKIGVDKFDIILEDGLHEYNANICCFENSIDMLADDGVYIVEDVYNKDQNKFIQYFKEKNYLFTIVDIYHDNNKSNNCIITVRKNV